MEGPVLRSRGYLEIHLLDVADDGDLVLPVAQECLRQRSLQLGSSNDNIVQRYTFADAS